MFASLWVWMAQQRHKAQNQCLQSLPRLWRFELWNVVQKENFPLTPFSQERIPLNVNWRNSTSWSWCNIQLSSCSNGLDPFVLHHHPHPKRLGSADGWLRQLGAKNSLQTCHVQKPSDRLLVIGIILCNTLMYCNVLRQRLGNRIVKAQTTAIQSII